MDTFKFYLIVFWPHMGGLALGLILAFIARHRLLGPHDRTTRVLTIIGAGVALVAAIAPSVLGVIYLKTQLSIPEFIWAGYDTPSHYARPLVVGLFSIVLLLFVPRAKSFDTGADLTPKSIASFTRPGAFITIGRLPAAAVAVAIAAGRMATTDGDGSSRIYAIESGGLGGATEIYGWYYSLPSLITLGMLLLLALIALWRIARPPLGTNPTVDTAIRRYRSGVVSASVIAAILLHLGYVGVFLAGTASLTVGGIVGDGRAWVNIWPTFAALEATLRTTGLILQLAGISVWAYLFWRAVLGDQEQRI